MFVSKLALPNLVVSALTDNGVAKVFGGTAIATNVALSGVAPKATYVALFSSNANVATVPHAAMLATGKSSNYFPVYTSKLVNSISTVTISASYSGVSKSLSLTVYPAPTLSSITDGGILSFKGGAPFSVTISLLAPVGLDSSVAVSSSNTGVATTPGPVTVAAGSAGNTFTVTSKAVAANTFVTLTASLGGVLKTLQVEITP